mmetsp:Transcript_2660/g.3873  ORF Transcript_2660/g.3873 Transcript_2660/m.3873 type:complete len:85 (+) Transcript_2660:1177-1431(+)
MDSIWLEKRLTDAKKSKHVKNPNTRAMPVILDRSPLPPPLRSLNKVNPVRICRDEAFFYNLSTTDDLALIDRILCTAREKHGGA